MSDRGSLDDAPLDVGAAHRTVGTMRMTVVRSFRRHPALGFFNCLVLELARNAGHLPIVVTLDRPFAKLGGALKLS